MPDWVRYVSERLYLPGVPFARRQRIVEELAEVLEESCLEARAQGLSEEEARQKAEQDAGDWSRLSSELGQVERAAGLRRPARDPGVEERPPDASERGRMGRLLDDLGQDLREGFRGLRRRPLLMGAAAVALSLGIGANTAIFSLVEAAVLRPLPYSEPERLAVVWEKPPSGRQNVVSAADYLDWRDQSTSFAAMCALAPSRFNLSGGGNVEQVLGARVTAGFFDLLGVHAALGRTLLPRDETPGAERVVVLGDPLWRRRFGSDPRIVGREMRIDGEPVRIVGVMPPDFRFGSNRRELWTPLRLDPASAARDLNYLRVVARLEEGVPLAQARAEMEAIAAGIAAAHPDVRKGWSVIVLPLRDWLVDPQFGASLVALLCAAGFLLLLACVNVASMLLARAASRQREVAIRLSLGARPGRITRQLLTEGALLAALGGLAGIVTTFWFGRAFSSMPQSEYLPAGVWPEVNLPLLLFTVAVCSLTTAIFGLAPAWRAARAEPLEFLKGRSPFGGTRGHRFLRTLAASEVALAVVLSVGAGLLARSLVALYRLDPGVRTERVLTAKLSLPETRYPDAASIASFYREALPRIEAIPGVLSADIATELPLAGSMIALPFQVVGQPVVPRSERPDADIKVVSPGYFETLGLRVVRGRRFDETDQQGSLPVAIVNETLARRFLPDGDPLLASLQTPALVPGGRGPRPTVTWSIVGVVADVKVWGLRAEVPNQIYLPHVQSPWPSTALAVHAGTDEMWLARPVQEAILEIDDELPLTRLSTMEDVVAFSTHQPRFQSLLMGVFAAIALALAGLGVYGVVAYSVSERTREIGIRLAVGASPSRVLAGIMRETLSMALWGVILGVLAAIGLARFMASQLFGITPLDLPTYGAVVAVLGLAAAAAGFFPAYRASQIDPAITLKHEH
jgi:putative ABC transport system permease protein